MQKYCLHIFTQKKVAKFLSGAKKSDQKNITSLKKVQKSRRRLSASKKVQRSEQSSNVQKKITSLKNSKVQKKLPAV